MSVAVSPFVPASHDDPIELQLKELRLQQQQQESRQKKPRKKPAPHPEMGQVEPLPSSEARAPLKLNDQSKPSKPVKNPSVIRAPAAADIAQAVEPSAAASGALASIKKSGKSAAPKSSKSLAGIPASAADVTVGLEASSPTLARCSSSRAVQATHDKRSKMQAIATQWAVGAVCMAKYAGDGKFYAAEVVQVVDNDITVSFTEYESDFQTCVANDLQPIVSKSVARGRSAKIAAASTTAPCADLEHGMPAGNQSEPSLPAQVRLQSQQHPRKEASVILRSDAAKQQLPQHHKPLLHARPDRDSKTALPSAFAESIRPLPNKSSKKQMPEHAQEWEKDSAARDSHQLAKDPDCSDVDLSSVGLVTPVSSARVPVSAPAVSQAAIQTTKPLSAFDLAKIRADERAAQQLQQVRQLFECSPSFFCHQCLSAASCSKVAEQTCGNCSGC
jgi:hypothetical protein